MRYFIGLLLFFSVGIFAKEFNTGYYIQHPEALQKIVQKCEISELSEHAYCEEAFALAKQFAQLFQKFIQSPQTWGKYIMEKQYLLVELQEKNENKEQIEGLKQEIASLQTIARLASGR